MTKELQKCTFPDRQQYCYHRRPRRGFVDNVSTRDEHQTVNIRDNVPVHPHGWRVIWNRQTTDNVVPFLIERETTFVPD